MKLHLKKLNAIGVAHILVPLLIIVGAGVIGSFFLVASHADSASVVINPIDWKASPTFSSKNISIVKDGSKGNVLRLNSAGSASVYLNKSAKLLDFSRQHDSQQIKACINVRANAKTQVDFALINMTTASNAALQKRINLTTAYETDCYTFKMAKASFIGSGKYSPVSVSTWAVKSTDVVYVNSVTLTVL